MKRLLDFFSPDRATKCAFVLFLLSAPAFFWCRQHHFCMAGHLQHPEEYSPLAYANDALWMSGFLASIILAFRSDVTFRYIFVFALGVLFLLVADPRSSGGMLIFPVLLALGLLSIACLAGWVE